MHCHCVHIKSLVLVFDWIILLLQEVSCDRAVIVGVCVDYVLLSALAAVSLAVAIMIAVTSFQR